MLSFVVSDLIEISKLPLSAILLYATDYLLFAVGTISEPSSASSSWRRDKSEGEDTDTVQKTHSTYSNMYNKHKKSIIAYNKLPQ